MSFECKNFRSHHLRPDKCKNCFADKSKHERVDDEQQATSDDGKQASNDDNYLNQVEDLSKELLVEELKRCHEERSKLKELQSVFVAQKDELAGENERLKLNEERSISSNGSECNKCTGLRTELESIKSQLESAERDRRQARDELGALEKEMEEMHDNFKEEESEQFEQLKQELDLAMKNCKILQIRLNKSERQYNQLEQVKSMLERQLEETCSSESTSRSSGLLERQNSSGLTQIGVDFVKLAASEYDQLLRDLNDTIEREKDLQEQIKYSQEEAQLKSDRLQTVEGENEVLLSKVNKLTLANSKLRSNPFRHSSSTETAESRAEEEESTSKFAEAPLIEQNEQLKLALELAQSECQRLKAKLVDLASSLESKESAFKDCEAKALKMEAELSRLRASRPANQADLQEQAPGKQLELEIRQLRTRLVQSERECKQLKGQLEVNLSGRQSQQLKRTSSGESNGEQAKYKELNKQLKEQCDSLMSQNLALERRIELLRSEENVGKTQMESDLLEKLKRQLDSSESELANARSRLVELDVESARNLRQYKRLMESLERSGAELEAPLGGAKQRLPPEAARDSMSRQELRQALKELEEEVEQCLSCLRSKNCLISEQSRRLDEMSPLASANALTLQSSTSDEQLKSVRRLLEQERLLSNNLKLDVSKLELAHQELQTGNRMLERERVSMDEELEKMRQVKGELAASLEEIERSQRATSNRLKEAQGALEKMRAELVVSKQANGQLAAQLQQSAANEAANEPAKGSGGDLLLMARDLSELKVKNGFLMRQLEIAREDASRQVAEAKDAAEAQVRRAVELAQLELKERQLAESQQLRDELSELKQRLAGSQRQAARNEEEASQERDRLRSMERDWRRDKSQWQQRLEQLEAQLAIERRSNEFKAKEWEALIRDKERALVSVQDRYVQLERDLKRTQNKLSLVEENSESKQKSLGRDLEAKKRELSELIARAQTREDEYYDNCKRFNQEKATLVEALESIRRSYDEKLVELKSVRELMLQRQDQAFKERAQAQERVDGLSARLISMGELETSAKLSKQQVAALERQLETNKRDTLALKEERARLKSKCDELERRCLQYEKQELISKTNSISTSTNSFLRNPFNSSKSSAKEAQSVAAKRPLIGEQRAQEAAVNEAADAERRNHTAMVERLSGKINDQRHLINLLKQQLDESQAELKRLKLVELGERNNWQSRVSQLQSQINDCEERLLFESSSHLSKETFESARQKLEIKWLEERRANGELVSQLQNQNDSLMRQLKKVSQSQDMLRLQSKQLEAHNSKLSRKLIEYQAGSSDVPAARPRELEACLRERDRLARANARLLGVLRDEARPLVESVGKMLAALDSSDQATNLSREASLEEQQARERPNSAQRPLVTPTSGSKLSSDSQQSDLIASARPAHQLASSSPSRLSRLLGKQPKAAAAAAAAAAEPPPAADSGSAQKQPQAPPRTAKVVRRVKVKSAALGITPGERRQLRVHLKQLGAALDELAARGEEWAGPPSGARASSEVRAAEPLLALRSERGASCAPSYPNNNNKAASNNSSPNHSVHWQLETSDLDSERSYSTSQLDRSNATTTDFYRRFPQTSPASYASGGGASLTDCDSESSLASDYSSSYPKSPARRSIASGAESDSCLGQLGPHHKGGVGGRKRGLKGRLTSTLRNISRSIGALASDSESNAPESAGLSGATPTGSKLRGSREIEV